MKKRPKGFLAEDKIEHDSEIFSYVAELHDYLWKFMWAASPGCSGNLDDMIDEALLRAQKIRKWIDKSSKL